MTERIAKSFRVQIEGLEELADLRKLLGEAQYQKIVAGAGDQVAEKIRAQRNPENGEFPVVCSYPIAEDALRMEIEATAATHEFLAERLAEMGFNFREVTDDAEEKKDETMSADDDTKPIAFLAHATEDKPLARQIAKALYDQGIQTFFDEWEIRAGDSIRQKLEEGLAACTHFLVLLTPVSIDKPWVNREMDAGFVGMVGGRNRFIGLRAGVEPAALSPFLQTLLLLSVQNATFDSDLERLVGDIYGVSRRPALGQTPTYAKASVPEISAGASQLAKHFVETSEHARVWDPQTNFGELHKTLNMPEDDLIDAIDELKGLGCIKEQQFIGSRREWGVGPEPRLFVRFDKHWKDWDAAKDAVLVAQQVHAGTTDTATIAKTLGWEPRRMNPALEYLMERDIVMSSESISNPFTTDWVQGTDNTRRFLKKLS